MPLRGRTSHPCSVEGMEASGGLRSRTGVQPGTPGPGHHTHISHLLLIQADPATGNRHHRPQDSGTQLPGAPPSPQGTVARWFSHSKTQHPADELGMGRNHRRHTRLANLYDGACVTEPPTEQSCGCCGGTLPATGELPCLPQIPGKAQRGPAGAQRGLQAAGRAATLGPVAPARAPARPRPQLPLQKGVSTGGAGRLAPL